MRHPFFPLHAGLRRIGFLRWIAFPGTNGPMLRVEYARSLSGHGRRAPRWRTQGRTVATSPATRWKRRWKWSTSPGSISASCSATTTTTWTRFRAHAFRWQPQSRQWRAAALGTFRFRVAALSGIHRQRNVKDCAFSASRFKNSRPRPTSLLDFIRSAPPQAGGAR